VGWSARPLRRTALIVLVAAATMAVVDGPVAGVRALPTPARPKPVSVQSVTAPPGPTAPHPVAFAPGACLAYPPTSGDRRKTVFLDPGHGGPDPGTSGVTSDGQTVSEKDLTLPVALAAAQLLRARGYRVALSRTTDSTVIPLTPDDLDGNMLSITGNHADLLARDTCANLAGAAALVSVHLDGYPDSSVGGALTVYDAVRPFSAANLALATLLQQDITAALTNSGQPVTDLGVGADDTAGSETADEGAAYGHLIVLGPSLPGYVDQPSQMPGALIEPLFLTNPAECDIAASPAGQQIIAGAIANAVTTFLPG
jgi:N-acetylmuramoyl-L-alanine amidase